MNTTEQISLEDSLKRRIKIGSEVINKLRAENAELRKLVKPPVYAFTETEWKEWSAQHPILKEQP